MNVLDMFSMKEKVAVITGGAGNYGKQIVEALAEAGATCYVASRNLEVLRELAEKHRAKGEDVHALQYDQGDEKSIYALRDQVIEKSGTVDVLVNNSVARVTKKGWESEVENFDKSMHINATGLFLITRAFGEEMIKRNYGSIVNIGSIMGMVGLEQHNYDGTDMGSWSGDYFFHKGGMINFTRFCASYFGRYNIRVNCISPGGLRVPSQPEQFIKNYSERTQLGRLANDSDLKGAVLLMASDASAYITGTNLPVDGGYTAK